MSPSARKSPSTSTAKGSLPSRRAWRRASSARMIEPAPHKWLLCRQLAEVRGVSSRVGTSPRFSQLFTGASADAVAGAGPAILER